MPRGGSSAGRGKKSHKGQRRHFTSEDELAAQRERERKENAWKARRDPKASGDEEEEEAVEEGGGAAAKIVNSSDETSSSDDDDEKVKGVQHLIEIENPNRIQKKTKKVTDITLDSPTELSRREREELQKQQAKAHYQKLHLEGKTDEARADLARLAIIRKQREEANLKREQERIEREQAKKQAEDKLKEKREKANAD